ncbi:component of IIS longevity pathway SMK-1-domain-containing protein [Crassisporium funariophilum]|nr:component of IIS longevity pathway SMK-1-domain-containing protein [Crassisporium funariophilum]
MNGLASAGSHSQSLLHTPTNPVPAAASLADDNSGAVSTSIPNPQPSPQLPSTPSISDPTPATDIASTANDVSPRDPQALTTPSGTQEEDIQKAEVHVHGQDKGGAVAVGNEHIEPQFVKEESDGALELVPRNNQIELVEHMPEAGIGLGEAGLMINEEAQEWIPDADHELKRVKVYELIGSRWIDQGTAFCFGQFQEETNEALLIARSERNYHDIVLSTAIRSNDVYQRQQDTLIVWTEPDGVDYALSFQDPEGCAEVWNFILEVQRHMNNSDDQTNVPSSPLLGPEASVTTASIIRSGHLPAPQLGIIGEIERAIKTLARTQVVKERICEYIQHEDYIKSLIEVMHTAEDLESLENLHALCSMMQTILMLNDHGMYEHILEDDIFFGVVGMLEYDPDFPGHKANYRDFLHNTSQFHQPIPLRDLGIQRKIHHTYRLQFLKDVVLARALDDSTFNVLNSCIIFNQIDIITHVQQDPMFLRDVVRLFVDEEMLAGGGGPPAGPPPGGLKRPIQGQQIQPQAHPQQQQTSSPTPPQHMVISLNGNGDNVCKPDAAPMEVDPAAASTSSPKPVNGATVATMTTTPNGRPTAPSKRSGCYAFAPPDNLTEAEISLRRDVIVLLQNLCVMGKNVQLPARMALFRTLVDRGVLFAVQWALNLPEKEDVNKQMISAAGEVLSALLDHDLNGVRGHVLKQVVAIDKEREARKKGADKAETILEMVCRIMAQSRDLAVQSQIGDALKVWMDVPSIDLNAGAGASSEASGPKPLVVTRKDDPGTERYMDYFYKECIGILLKPFSDIQEWRNVTVPTLPLTREETNRYVYLCDLLHNFLLQHHFRSHFHLVSSNVLPRVATLLKAKDKHLRHSAFRIFRLLLKQNNPNSHTQLMKHDLLKPILDLTIQESRRDNLLSCSCQEYFENMRRENMKDLIKFCMTKHEPEIQLLAKSPLGGQRFELFIRRWEMNNEPLPEESKPERPADGRGFQGRVLDLAEEDYFNADDDDDESIPAISQQWLRGTGATSPLAPNNTGMKRKRRIALGSQPKGYRPPLKTPQLNALVDYDEDDEEPNSTERPVTTPEPGQKPTTTPTPENPSSVSIPTKTALALSSSSGPPPKRISKEDDADENLLEALARPTRLRSQSPAPSGSLSMGPMRPSEKRRRADDEEDGLLERLSKSKKTELGNQKEGAAVRQKNGDDPPAKKIKVKFGAVGLAVASMPPSPQTTPTTPTSTTIGTIKASSETGAKDGDIG